ncbi:hypothetical protein B0J17DRAFT_721998 [Rhizoctonia solani]|nr:hypothetical protein B0J17DRAFT_721998 [Rhizoctonia solani]
MPVGSFSTGDGPEAGETRPDCALSDSEVRIDHNPEPTPQCREATPPQDEALVLLTPLINTLPTEIITRIFEFTYYLWQITPINRERVARERNVRDTLTLGYPEVLSHVCSLWREIVLASPVLWTDLELCSFDESSQTFLSRCSAFVPRAQNQDFVLNIRLYHREIKHLATTRTAMEEFCSSVGPRLRSLRIDNHSPNDATFFSLVFQAGLLNTTPGH